MTQQEITYKTLIDQMLTFEGSMTDTYSRFYNYSYYNMALLYYQGVKTPVATYKKWLELGRQVQKGQKAKVICMPRMYKNDEDETEIAGFSLRPTVFEYSQTDGEELEMPQPKTWHILTATEKLGIKEVSYNALLGSNGNAQGYSIKTEYAVSPMAKYPLKTTLHEIAHIVLGHTTRDTQDDEHSGIREFQAEATAYLVMKELKMQKCMNESESRAYVQNWVKGQEITEKDLKSVFTAVNKIINAGREEA